MSKDSPGLGKDGPRVDGDIDAFPAARQEPEQVARAKLVAETAKIPWRQLQRFFAGGTAIFVSADIDLIEAAYQLSQDNVEQVRAWRAEGLLDQVADGQALDWFNSDALVWSVVVRPWVLVQAVGAD